MNRFLDHNELIKLEGNAFCEKFYESKEKYIKDVNNTIEDLSKSLIRQTLDAIDFDVSEKGNHYNEITDDKHAWHSKHRKAICNILVELNIKYHYNKELFTKLFTSIMTRVLKLIVRMRIKRRLKK